MTQSPDELLKEVAELPDTEHPLWDHNTRVLVDFCRRLGACLKYQRDLNDVLEQDRPHWAKGYTSDSIAAQCSSSALSQLWKLLDVKDQTAAVLALERLRAQIHDLQVNNEQQRQRALAAEAKHVTNALAANQDPRLNDPVSAILFALETQPDPRPFLEAWNEGNLDDLSNDWPEFQPGYGR